MTSPAAAIFMAGGSGERFWPLSRQHLPKQLIRLTHESRTMLADAVERIKLLVPDDRILISTNKQVENSVRESLDFIPPQNVLAEPYKRNTAGCVAFAAAHILERFGDEGDLLLAFITADHRIGNAEAFKKTATEALSFAENHNALVLIGLVPTRPETAFGYMEIPDKSQSVFEKGGISIYPVSCFREKPGKEEAQYFYSSEKHFWNTGMIFCRMSVLLDSLKQWMPELLDKIYRMRDVLQSKFYSQDKLAEIFETVPNTSIDYDLMERADNVFMALGQFDWDDVGSWDSLSRFWPLDEQGNVAVGNPILVDCQNVTVYNNAGADNIAVGVLGMEDVVVVATPDGILVCPKNRAQEIRKIVDALKTRGAGQL